MEKNEGESVASGHEMGKGAIWSVLNQSVAQLMTLAVFLVTARYIPKEDFGTMAIAMLVVEVMRQLTIESIGTTLLARPNPDRADYNAGFILVILSCILGAVVIYSSAGLFAGLMDNRALEGALHWICLIILTFGASRIHEAWLARNMMFKPLALRSIFAVIVGGAVGIVMAVKGFGLESLIAQQVITTSVSAIFLWAVTAWRPGLVTTREKLVSVFSYARHISMTNVANLANAQSDIFLTSYFLGAAQTGVYNAAKRLILSADLMMSSAIRQVSMPALSNAGHDRDALRSTYQSFSLFTSLFTAPAFAGLAALATPVVSILLGVKWAEAAPVLAVLCLPCFLNSLGQLGNQIFLTVGKPGMTTILAIVNAILNVAFLVAVGRYGLIYVAWAFAIKTLVMMPVTFFYAHKYLDLSARAYFGPLVPSFLSAAAMGTAVMYGLYFMGGFHPVVQIGVLAPAGIVFYVGMAWMLDRSSALSVVSFLKTYRR